MATLAFNPTYLGQIAALSLKTLDINQTNTDIGTVTVPFAKYIVRRVTIYDASTSLAASSAQTGVFTAAAGGGTAIVSAATMTALSASSKFADRTVAVSADYQTAGTLYFRSTVAHGSAATLSCVIEVQQVF